MAKSGRGVIIAKRRQLVLRFKESGMALRAIAEAVTKAGYPCGYVTVKKDIDICLEMLKREHIQDMDRIRTIELKRLDTMLESIWQKVLKGDAAAVDRAIKIQERRSKLLGLEAPTKIIQDIDSNIMVEFVEPNVEDKTS